MPYRILLNGKKNWEKNSRISFIKSDQVGSNIIFRESQKYIDNKISILLIEEEEDIEKRNTRCPQIRIYELSLPFWEGREERDEDHSDKTAPTVSRFIGKSSRNKFPDRSVQAGTGSPEINSG